MRRTEICDLGATVAKIRDRNPLAPTVRPQFIVGMLAPTSGVQGRGEIGAALSLGIESGPDFRIQFICTQVNKNFGLYAARQRSAENGGKPLRRCRRWRELPQEPSDFLTLIQVLDGPER